MFHFPKSPEQPLFMGFWMGEFTTEDKPARYGKNNHYTYFDTQIPHSIRAVEATAEGKSIFAYDKGGKVAAAYEQFGKTNY